jgi:glycerol-3-phosphate acyltransferase PlsX
MRIGLDVMGGDYAPDAPIAGAVLAQQLLPNDVRIVLIGDEQQITELLAKHGADKNNFDIVHTSEVIGMGEHPTKAFTQKPNSSITIGFGLLAAKKIDAFASNGNTGAMMVGSMFAIKAIPGVIRPCITTILPKEDGTVGLLLDVGINADCKPDVLCQFGLLGSLFAEYVYGIKNPKVGLLNIGEEPEKGNLLAQAAHGLMKESKDFNFIGNIEGRDIFDNKADVVVCDGFTGNVVLKLAESTYTTLKRRGLCDDYFERYNYENYGGTPLLGINSTVMIGHGISNAKAVKNMLLLTKEVVDAKLSEKIQKALSNE